MLLFHKIRWRNLLSTGNTFTEIELDKHSSTLIVGANGAGKSTILDALSFVLYGKPFRKVNKGQLVNSINGKGTLVEVEFSIGKKQYLIRRGIKPNLFEIVIDGVLVDQSADAKDYQEYLETQILKLNHKSFSQIVVLGSASFVPFMQLKAADRRDIVEDVLDIQIFSTMNALLKKKVDANKSSITDTDYHIHSAGEKIELYNKHIDSLKRNNEGLIAQKQIRIDQVQSEVDSTNEMIKSIERNIEQFRLQIVDQDKMTKKLAKMNELVRQISTKKSNIIKDNKFFQTNDDCPICRQGIAHDHKQSIVQKNVSDIQDIELGEQKLESEMDAVRKRLSEIDSVNDAINKNTQQIATHKIEIRTAQGVIRSLQSEIQDLANNTSQIQSNEDEVVTLKQGLKDNITKKEDLLRDKKVFEIASALLKDSGIKTKIIKQYIPIINKLINKYLASMDFFVNFEMNEVFEETIKSRFRDEFTYDSFSEGEKTRIDLSILFAWRAVAKLRNSVSTNLLIMDEVFDSSLDVQGGDELIKIIQSIVGDSNIFVISHRTDQMLDKFEHVIRFEKAKNFSKIAS